MPPDCLKPMLYSDYWLGSYDVDPSGFYPLLKWDYDDSIDLNMNPDEFIRGRFETYRMDDNELYWAVVIENREPLEICYYNFNNYYLGYADKIKKTFEAIII